MNTAQYLVLQCDPSSHPFTAARTTLEAFSAAPRTPQPPRLRLETPDLSDAEAESVLDDPSTVGFCPVMPLKKIEPHALDAGDAAITGAGTAWGVGAVGADRTPYTGAGVAVAVLDTGIDRAHPAFRDPSLEIVEKNFTSEPDHDSDGHGTHVAGTVFGRDVDGVRIGVARGVERAIVAKVIGRGSTTGTLTRAIEWAAKQGAHVISMSLGIDFVQHIRDLHRQPGGEDIHTSISRALINYRRTLEVLDLFLQNMLAQAGRGRRPLVIAASGNESDWRGSPQRIVGSSPPASAHQIVSVGAVGRGTSHGTETVANFSNARPRLVGPGVEVLSAWPGGGLRRSSGTSMATPHVAGVAALWAEKQLVERGSIDTEELEADVVGHADSANPGSRAQIGVGLVRSPTEG